MTKRTVDRLLWSVDVPLVVLILYHEHVVRADPSGAAHPLLVWAKLGLLAGLVITAILYGLRWSKAGARRRGQP